MPEALPGLHDCEIVGIAGARAEGRLSVQVQHPDGTRETLLFTGCPGWRITEFLPQNVVSQAARYQGAEDEAAVCGLLDWLAASPSGASLPATGTGTGTDALARAILGGRLRIASFDASTGANAVIVYRDLTRDTSG